MAEGFMYLVAIIDVYSRFVVGWYISNNMDADWVVETLQAALIYHGKPHIVNSDQSMDGKGRAIENVYIERLWRTVKYDYIYICPPEYGWQLY